ncbi:MAG: ATP-dependent DNA helicase RecG [Candidatus Eremiobacteraeota bacterium]|nr:ATP-dependent DNA helicase RecG [Candidatus Eremiobacteraeota bacterium]
MLISQLAGVGKDSAARFAELGVSTAEDLLEYFPHRYEDLRFPTAAAQLGATDGEENAVGRIVRVRERRARLAIVEADIEDATGAFTAKWFGRSYLVGALKPGMELFVRGRVTRTFSGASMNVTTHKILENSQAFRGEIVPVYPASKTLTSRKIRQVVARNLTRLLELAVDPLPRHLARRFAFDDVRDAYAAIHAPRDLDTAVQARRRFIFTEFLGLALAAALKRNTRVQAERAAALSRPGDLTERLESAVSFSLTNAQRRVLDEIWADMARDVPMNRLLQGDVGSGKTLVAAGAILMAALNGKQSALMAPTEILASQHAEKLAPLLLPFGIAVESVLGSQGSRSRSSAVGRLASGEAALAIGTHALLTEGVDFARLGLVVIDEQHRFGVEQRARLRAKGLWPHTLHMTATPIPRTLAQTVYADLDVSTIDELPPGRTPIDTFVIRRARLPLAYEFVERNAKAGRQAYVVAPAIEESEFDLTSVVALEEELRRGKFADLRVGLLHGKLTPREKEGVMQRFVRGGIDVLVATTVVEVGVDVPNATVMLVLDAQRYGLAQLHQLRGRVGRGAARSYCVLVAPDDAPELERLSILAQTTDGFVIAEEDLRLRGPGEFAGTAQSGVANFRHADLVRDFSVYSEARAAAEAIVRDDPELKAAQHAPLRALLDEPSARAMLMSS